MRALKVTRAEHARTHAGLLTDRGVCPPHWQPHQQPPPPLINNVNSNTNAPAVASCRPPPTHIKPCKPQRQRTCESLQLSQPQ